MSSQSQPGMISTSHIPPQMPPVVDRHALGAQLYGAGHFPEALQMLDQALLEAGTAELWNDWGAAQLACGDPGKAEKGFRLAWALEGESGDAAVNLSALLIPQGRIPEAMQILEAALAHAGDAHRPALAQLLDECRRQVALQRKQAAANAASKPATEMKAAASGNPGPSRLLNPADWHDPEFLRIAAALHLEVLPDRKLWESVQTIRALEAVGMLDGTKTGVGIGAASDVLCYYLPQHAVKVCATDLYGGDSGWQGGHLNLEPLYARSPFPCPRERLQFRRLDMRNLDFLPASVDFLWSCSAVEHIPTPATPGVTLSPAAETENRLREYMKTWSGISRTLKPGGYAAIVTGFNLRSQSTYQHNLVLMDEALLARIEAETDLRLAGPLDLSVTDHPFNAPFVMDYLRVFPCCRQFPNLWSQQGDALFTAGLFLFQKNSALPLHRTVGTPDQGIVKKYWDIGRSLQRQCQQFFAPSRNHSNNGQFTVNQGRLAVQSDGNENHVAYGPYVAIPSGRYLAQFRLRVDQIPSDFAGDREVCLLDICSASDGANNRQDAVVSLRHNQMAAGQETECELRFASDGARLFEFRVLPRAGVKLTYFGASLWALD